MSEARQYHTIRLISTESTYSVEDRIAGSIKQIKEILNTEDVRVEIGKDKYNPDWSTIWVNGIGHSLGTHDLPAIMLALEFFIRGLNQVETQNEDAEEERLDQEAIARGECPECENKFSPGDKTCRHCGADLTFYMDVE